MVGSSARHLLHMVHFVTVAVALTQDTGTGHCSFYISALWKPIASEMMVYTFHLSRAPVEWLLRKCLYNLTFVYVFMGLNSQVK